MEGSCRVPIEERLDVFALVIYIPGPLGIFLDDLRRELVPGCNPHAHVSVLPPRSLGGEWQVASQQVRALTESWTPFEIELTGIQVFPGTEVIYIEIGAGAGELRNMHRGMNSATLEFEEPFPYHPHITLAQELAPGQVTAVNQLARRRWQEFQGERRFGVGEAVFVQNTLHDCWIDLAGYSLGKNSTKS